MRNRKPNGRKPEDDGACYNRPVRAGLMAWALAIAGCFNPSIPQGVPCDPSGGTVCPNGQECDQVLSVCVDDATDLVCKSSATCDAANAGDLCEDTERCSRVDDACASGQRYRLSEQCVAVPPDPIGPWVDVSSEAQLSPAFARATAQAGDRIYVLGGAADAYVTEVRSGPTPWSLESAPLGLLYKAFAAAASANAVFTVGGRTGKDADESHMDESVVRVSAVNMTDRTLGPWQDVATPLPTARRAAAAVVHGDALIVFGGRAGTKTDADPERVVFDEVLYAKVTGATISGNWEAAPPLPSARHSHGATVHVGGNGGLPRVILTGGRGDAGFGNECKAEPLAETLVADIDIDIEGAGKTSAFRPAAPLRTARWDHGSIAIGRYVMVMGGYTCDPARREVFDAEFAVVHDEDGTLGPWHRLSAAFATKMGDARRLSLHRVGEFVYAAALSGRVIQARVRQP